MPAEQDGDLMLCREHGLAYQLDRAHGVAYDAAYFERTGSHPAAMVDAINDARIALVARHIGAARSEERRVGKECSLPCRSRWSPYH